MDFVECNSWYSPVTQKHEISLRFATCVEELEGIYEKLPHDSLSSLEFKNIVGLALSKEPIEKIQTKYELEQSVAKGYAVPSFLTEEGTRKIVIEKETD
jgi:hypothetical protein